MKIDEYIEDLYKELALSAEANDTSREFEFFNKVAGMLSDADEFDDFYECHQEALSKNRGQMEMDGYAFDETDGSVCVFILDYRGPLNKNNKIIAKDIEDKFNKIRRFVEEASKKILGFEESSQEYEFNQKLKDGFDYITKFRFYIFTDAFNNQRVKNVKDININGKIVERNVWDINRIFDLECSTAKKETIEIKTEDYDVPGIPCVNAVDYNDVKSDFEKINGNDESNLISYKSYLAVIRGDLLSKLYIDYGSRLLEGNVRSFLSVKGAVNKGIRRTISYYPEMFFAYNNGIAATATEVDTKMTQQGLIITRIKDLQIVNGGQTTASIANAVLNPKKDENIDTSKIFVPMKLSVLEHSIAERIIPKISEYSNSQNKVDASDFFSNHPFHIRMEDYSRKIAAPAINGNQYQQYWFYERTRGQYNQGKMKLKAGSSDMKKYETRYPASQVIKLVDLARFMEIYYCEPDKVSKGKQALVREFSARIKDQWEKDETVFNQFYFKRAIALAIMYRDTDKVIKNKDWYKLNHSYKANVIAYTLCVLLNYIRKTYSQYDFDYLKVWNDQKIYPELENQISILVDEVYEYITSPTRKVENVTEWCKKSECWKEAQGMEWSFDDDFLATLILNDENKSKQKEEKVARKIEKEVDGIKFIMQKGTTYWNRLYEWGISRNLLSEKDISLIKMAENIQISGKIPSDKQVDYIIKIRDRMLANGMPLEF